MQMCGSLKERRNLIFFLCLLCFTDFSNSQYITGISVTTDTTILVDGVSHILTCSVLGGPVTQMFWYFEEQMISNSNPHYSISSNSLEIIVFSSADEGAYSCVAENNRGRIVSSSLQLQLAYFSVDTAKLPDFQLLILDSGFSLSCPLSAYSSLPPPTVTWKHDGVLVDTVYPLVLSLDHELIFTTVKSSDSGQYSCVVTNSLLNIDEVFDVAAVTISQDSTVGEFFITPNNETVIEGDDVSFQCIITQGSTVIPVVWYFGDTVLLDSQRIQLSLNSFILTVAGVRNGDTGSYSCALSTSLSDKQYFTLSVISRPDIISNQSLYSELPEGSNISLSCQSEGAPPLSYSWYYNADPLDPTLLEEIEIFSVSTTDSGIYQCFVENSAGIDTNTFIVNVKTLTPQFISLQNDVLAFVGSNFTFACEATSAAALSYVFSVNNQTLPITGYLQHNDTHYSVVGAVESHSGVYTCRVSTSVGEISHTFIVQVVDATTPYTSLISNMTVFTDDDTVSLPCRAVADGGYPTLALSYRWEVDGVAVISDGHFQLTGNHGDLQINQVVLADAGEYTCVAVTSDTNLTLDSYLETVIGSTELFVVTVPGQPFNLEVMIYNSTSVRISWSPPANNGGVAIQSYIVEYLSENSWLTAGERIFTFLTFSVCPGYTYRFRALAVNGVGRSEASVSTRIVIPSLVPTISPINLSVRSALFQLSLEWEIPSSSTGCDINIINHSIHYYTLSQTSPISVRTGSSELSFILSGLNSFTSFNISVAFINSAGTGEYSQHISATTADLLAAPSSFEVESYGTGRIAIYFLAPSHAVITGYKLLCISQLGGVINRTLGPEQASQLTVISSSITQDINYSCTVSAFNAGGDGLLSVTKIVTPSYRKVPDPPLSLYITTSGSYTATFEWTPSDGTTQSLLTLYYRYSLTPHTFRRTDYHISHNPPYTNSSLSAGVDYSVRLAGVNEDGIGFNQTSEFSLPPGRPAVPLLFVFEELDVVVLSWSILHDGGSNITNVTVENLFESTWIALATYENNTNSSYRLNNAEKGFEFRIVISNSFGRTESTPVLIDSTVKPTSTLYIIAIAVLFTSTLIVVISLSICGLFYFSYLRQQKKSHSLSVNGNNKQSVNEESKIFRNLNNVPNQSTDKFPTRHSETSSDSTATDNPPSYHSNNPSYHSNNPSRDSKASYGSKSSKSSSSSRHRVEVIEQRQGAVSRGVLSQPGRIQSAKLAHKSVVFADHQAQTSGDSDSSWTNTFNRQVREFPTPINLEEYSPPLPPRRKGNSQPHPLSLTTNSYTNMLPGRDSELWDPRTEDTYPVLISHVKSRSDDSSDHYSTVFDGTPHPPSARSNKLTSSKYKIRSKSPMSLLTQKLSPNKARTSTDTPKPIPASPSDSPSNYNESLISNRVFVNQELRMPSPNFVEHQHSDSVPSQQTSSLSSAC